ncbi:hypothetical protein ABHI18_004445 [Aspergillus niger]
MSANIHVLVLNWSWVAANSSPTPKVKDQLSTDAILERTRGVFGYEAHGYWLWHNSEAAAADIEAHPESTFSLIFPQDPLLWKTVLCPRDKAAEWVRSGRTTPLPSWLTQEDRDVHHRVFSKGGYSGPLSWYKAAIRGINTEDEASINEGEGKCPVRNLFIAAQQDYICRAEMGTMITKMNVPDAKIEMVDCGHWVQLEKPEVVNNLLIEFAKEVVN